MIDMLPRKSAEGQDAFVPVCGGAMFNTAIALGRLGEDAALMSGVSTDLFGEKLIAALAASNVRTDLAPRSDRPSTLAFVTLLDGAARYTFMDENSASRMVLADEFPSAPPDVKAFHFGGISLVSEPGAVAFEAICERHHKQAVISLDPNIRPAFITDIKATKARLMRMAGMADIIKISDEDLDWFASGESGDALIAEWLSGGASAVLVTKGAEGIDAHLPAGSFTVPADPVAKIIDTVGAGDSFNGGFLTGLSRGGLLSKSALAQTDEHTLKPALVLAAQVAAHVVGKAGANPPWASELAEPND